MPEPDQAPPVEAHSPQGMVRTPGTLRTRDAQAPTSPTGWSYFYLYVILDIFSRYVVGWMVADRESSAIRVEMGSRTESRFLRGRVRPG